VSLELALLTTIRRDVLSKFTGEVLSRFIFLLFFFYLGRKLGTTDFGTLNLVLSTTFILGVVFLDPGLNISTIQLLINEKERAATTASSVFFFKVLLFCPLMVTVWVASLVFGSRLPSFAALFPGALFTLFTAVLEYFCSVTNAYHRMDIEALFKIFNRISIVVFGVAAIKVGRLPVVLWSMATATLLTCLLGWFFLRRYLVPIRFKWDPAIMKQALVTGLPVAGTLIVTAVYLKWDLVVLSYFNIGRQELGWYAAAFKIVEAFSAIPTLLGAALFPLMVQLRTQNPIYLDRMVRISVKGVLLFSIPAAAGISLLSHQIIACVYGAKYLPGASVLAVLIWCIVPIFLYFYLVFVNIAAGHARHNLFAGVAALAAGLIANTLLIPRIGYLGAAWSALIANSSFALLATWKVCRLFQNASLPPMLLRLLIAGALMSVPVFLSIPLRAQLGLGMIVYVIVLLALGALDGEDWSLALRLIQTRVQPLANQT